MRRLGRLWEELNLSARLMIGSGIALSLASTALLYSIVANDLDRNRRQLAEKLRDEIEFMVPAIAEQAVIGDYSLIEQMLKSRVDQPIIARAGWTDTMGNPVLAKGAAVKRLAPDWFMKWADLPSEELAKPVEIGGERYGTVFLQIDPVSTLNQVWQDSVDLLQLVLFGIGLLFSVTLAIASNALRPLVSLAQSAVRFGKGDYTVRIEGQGPPEVRASISAFNSMADNIQTLLTSLSESRNTLFAEKERAQVTLASIADAVITTDLQGNVEYLNPVAETLTGWTVAEAAGKRLSEIFRLVGEAGAQPPFDAVDVALAEGRADRSPRPAMLLARLGDEHPIEHTAAPIRNRDGVIIGAVLAFRDVGESRKMARQLSWQATHDSLTGLVNRGEFERRLNLCIQECHAGDTQHTLLYLDLDQFKVVNDTCGHVAGDELLRQITALLQKSIRESDTLARLGGDEFGVLLNGCSMERGMRIAETLHQSVAQFRFAWQEKTFVVGISIGVVSIAGEEQSARVLAAADAACYSAKDKGRNRIQAYLPGDTELAQRHGEMQWVSRLTRALEEDRLTLYCQLIRPTQHRAPAVVHYEILLRMIDEQGKLTPPMAFIPAAERYNLMPTVDRRVVARAFRKAGEMAAGAQDAPPAVLCINISGASLNEDSFLRYITEQFAFYSVPPRMICFEITETAAIANLTRATRVISELRALGCQFALDDFGSGLSSFAYLKNLPVDYLKIDGTFVKDMASDPIDRAMVKAIHEIGHVMGIKTIAEWVDNDETLGMLRQMGVDYVQGFGVAMPVPLSDIAPISPHRKADGVLATAHAKRHRSAA
jgi:diguanylate cyclase (GGDEF)-like protein/PAS domain S-box-containing protein